MIDILYNKLKAADTSVAEWKDVLPDIFNKHSQYSLNKPKTITIKPNKSKEVINAITEIAEVPLSQSQQLSPILAKNKKRDLKDTKDTTNKPLNIIISETTSFHNSTEYIKDALITMISKDEFTKVFGQTKCAEIMSGVVNNRWNKSTALFISFLLDKEVYYNEKVLIYNKEKNKGRITITKT